MGWLDDRVKKIPTTPSPGPGWTWNATTGQWDAPAGTAAAIQDSGAAGPIDSGTGKSPIITSGFSDPRGGTTATGAGDRTNLDRDARSTDNTNNTETLSAQLNAAATPETRAAPQAAAGPDVISDVATVTKPTATMATGPAAIATPAVAGPTAITTPTITNTTIAPTERVTAAQVAPTTGATAGVVNPAAIDTTQQQQFRAGEQDLVQQLQAASAGAVPSAAQAQAQRSSDEAVASQLGLVGMNHGRGAGAALRTAGRNIAGIQQKAALDNAQLRAQEQATARGQLGTALESARGADINLATKAADLTQGANTTTATLGTNVSISNADRDAARAMKDADLQQAAATGNAAAQNELAQRQAALDAATKTQNAGNAIDVGKTNQEVDLRTQLANATNAIDVGKANQNTDLATQLANAAASNTASIVGSTEQNKVGMANAANDLQAQIQNQNNATSVALKNAGFTLEGRTIDDARNVAAVNAALQAQSQLSQDLDKQKAMDLARAQFNQAVADKDWDRALQITTAVINASANGAAYASKSDERTKRDVKDVPDEAVARLAKSLEGVKSWRYKGELDDGQRHFGHMAQLLEQDPLGKELVSVDPADGMKQVDYQGLNSLLMAHAIRGRREARK